MNATEEQDADIAGPESEDRRPDDASDRDACADGAAEYAPRAEATGEASSRRADRFAARRPDRRDRPLNILTLSGLWPSRTRPERGLSIEQRLRRADAAGLAQIRVVAPTPWFPFAHPVFGPLAALGAEPRLEKRARIVVHRPRYPALAEPLRARLIAMALRRFARALAAKRGPFDLIDAHRVYPDGVAAAHLARALDAPFVVTAQPEDLALTEAAPAVQRQALRALSAAASVGSTSRGLIDALGAIGAAVDRFRLLRDGVDRDLFRPFESAEARRSARSALAAPQDAPLAVSVGPLLDSVGHQRAIDAAAAHPTLHLRISGDGPGRAALRARIDALGVADRVRLIAPRPYRDRRALYAAADVTLWVPARAREPEGLVESLACGAPVVATPVGDAPDVISAPAAGRLARDVSAPAVTDALHQALSAPPPVDAVRAMADRFDWNDTVRGVDEMFHEAVDGAPVAA